MDPAAARPPLSTPAEPGEKPPRTKTRRAENSSGRPAKKRKEGHGKGHSSSSSSSSSSLLSSSKDAPKAAKQRKKRYTTLDAPEFRLADTTVTIGVDRFIPSIPPGCSRRLAMLPLLDYRFRPCTTGDRQLMVWSMILVFTEPKHFSARALRSLKAGTEVLVGAAPPMFARLDPLPPPPLSPTPTLLQVDMSVSPGLWPEFQPNTDEDPLLQVPKWRLAQICAPTMMHPVSEDTNQGLPDIMISWLHGVYGVGNIPEDQAWRVRPVVAKMHSDEFGEGGWELFASLHGGAITTGSSWHSLEGLNWWNLPPRLMLRSVRVTNAPPPAWSKARHRECDPRTRQLVHTILLCHLRLRKTRSKWDALLGVLPLRLVFPCLEYLSNSEVLSFVRLRARRNARNWRQGYVRVRVPTMRLHLAVDLPPNVLHTKVHTTALRLLATASSALDTRGPVGARGRWRLLAPHLPGAPHSGYPCMGQWDEQHLLDEVGVTFGEASTERVVTRLFTVGGDTSSVAALPTTKLYAYQKDAVAWMLRREQCTHPPGEEPEILEPLTVCYSGLPEVPMTTAASAGATGTGLEGAQTVFEDVMSSEFLIEPPLTKSLPRGGMLCDVMGLGKTICVLALLVSHPRPVSDVDTTVDPTLRRYADMEPRAEAPERASLRAAAPPARRTRSARRQQEEGGDAPDGDSGSFFGMDQRLPPAEFLTLPRGKGTLVIVPCPLLSQWQSEVARHAPSLVVRVYNGIRTAWAADLLEADVVLTTYKICSKDMRQHGTLVHSPLLHIEWWRVVLDEAQLVATGSTYAAKMAQAIPRVLSWCTTGTPFSKGSFAELEGPCSFLANSQARSTRGLAPPASCNEPRTSGQMRALGRLAKAAEAEMQRPDAMRCFAAVRGLLQHIMWRHTKVDVKSDLALPPCSYTDVVVQLTPLERAVYDVLVRRTKADLVEPQGKKTVFTLTYLLQLRQVATHVWFSAARKNGRSMGATKPEADAWKPRPSFDLFLKSTLVDQRRKATNLLLTILQAAEVFQASGRPVDAMAFAERGLEVLTMVHELDRDHLQKVPTGAQQRHLDLSELRALRTMQAIVEANPSVALFSNSSKSLPQSRAWATSPGLGTASHGTWWRDPLQRAERITLLGEVEASYLSAQAERQGAIVLSTATLRSGIHLGTSTEPTSDGDGGGGAAAAATMAAPVHHPPPEPAAPPTAPTLQEELAAQRRSVQAVERSQASLAAVSDEVSHLRDAVVQCMSPSGGADALPGPCLEYGSKIARLVMHLEALGPREKVVVFSSWNGMIYLAAQALEHRGIRHLIFHQKGLHLIETWRQDPAVQVLFIPLRQNSGASGLTLTAAAHAVILEPSLDHGLEAQACARIHRLSQTRPVSIIRLCGKDTVEEKILESYNDRDAAIQAREAFGEDGYTADAATKLLQMLTADEGGESARSC